MHERPSFRMNNIQQGRPVRDTRKTSPTRWDLRNFKLRVPLSLVLVLRLRLRPTQTLREVLVVHMIGCIILNDLIRSPVSLGND